MSKLKLKYEVEVQCQAFYTGKSVQVSKNGQELLCDDVTSITITDLNTGQASKINHRFTEDDSITGTSKSSIIKVDDEEETAEDAFKDSRIKLEENDCVTAFQFSPDGSKLLVACSSLLLKLYSWPERKQLHQFRSYHRSPITCLAWDESSTLLISGSPDATARVWDTRRLCSTHCLRGSGGVFGCVTFHPNLHKHPFVYAGVANVLCVWKLSAGTSELVHRFEDAHYMNITNLVHIPDGKLVTCGLDCAAVLWDAATMTRLHVYMLEQAVAGAVLLPPRANDLEGTIRLAVAGETGRLCVHRMDTGILEYSSNALVMPTKGRTLAVTEVALCPALESVVLTTYDHSIIFVHLDDLQQEGSSELVPWKMLCGNNDQIFATIFVMFNLPSKKSKSSAEEEDDLEKSESGSATSNELLVVASNSPDLRVYQSCDLSVRVVRGHTEAVLALARHPALKDVFASSSRDRTVRVWRATAGGGAVCVAVAEGHSHVVATVFLGMDILVSGSEDTSFKRWALTEEKLAIIKGEKSATAAPQPLLCTCTQVGHDKDINSVCVAPRDRLVATGSGDKTVKVWSGRDLSLLGTLRGHKRGVWDVRFSPVDKLLASASADCTVKIWLLESYALATTLESHASGVLTVSWLNSGLQLLTSCSSGLLKLWEAKTGVCLETFVGHDEQRLWAVDTREDGARVVTAGEDARVVVWRDATKEVEERKALQRQQHQSQQQTLANLLLAERWQEALLLTLRLDQPDNSLKVIKGLFRTGGVPALARVTSSLEQHQLGTLVKFAVSWNTRTATCYYAQHILNLLLSTKLPEELEALPFWEHLLEAALSYTERHYTRVAALHQATGILEYCLGAAQLLHAGQDVLGGSLEEEDSLCEEIDDMTLLNQLQPQRPDKNSNKSESEDSESSEEEEEDIHDDNKKYIKSASDNEHSDVADVEQNVKSKKKLKKMSVENLEDGYVKERLNVTSAEKEDGDTSMEDEGVESGIDDSEVEDCQNHQEDSDNEHERRIASLQRGSHTSRGRGGMGNKDRDSRDYVRDSSVDDGQQRSMTLGRRGTRDYGGSYSRSPANRRGFGGPGRGFGGESNRGYRGQSGGYRSDRGRSPGRGGRGMSPGRGGRGMSFGRGRSGMSSGRGGRGMGFGRGGRGRSNGRGGRGSFRSRGQFS